MHPHILPLRFYFRTFFILMGLLVLTVAVSYVHLGPLNIVVALAIAGTKAAYVIMDFMHVRFGTRLVWFWAALGFVWLILLFLTLGDYTARNWMHTRGFYENSAPAKAPAAQ